MKNSKLGVFAIAVGVVFLSNSVFAADTLYDLWSEQGAKCQQVYDDQFVYYRKLEFQLLDLRKTLTYESNDSQERDGHRGADIVADAACAVGAVASMATGGLSVALCFPGVAVNMVTQELDRKQGLAENSDLQSRLDRLNEQLANVRSSRYRSGLISAAYRMIEHAKYPFGMGYFPFSRNISGQDFDGIQVEFSKISDSKLMPLSAEELTFAVGDLHARFSDCSKAAPNLNDLFVQILQNRH